ncbi:hypothetical protein O3M35_002735 [Rhynocoris fuscipes]|uniref:non-specific serine/threonine protein kinase n=1 Tax=Rhynocoris fuscipes TaxID=488301 RepID=A0AAW1CMH4_9HEMI
MSQRLEDYEVLGIIGRGSSGTCYKVRNKYSNDLYAWKAIDYGNLSEENKKLLVSEVNLLRSLNHPNIVKYCGKILHRETTTLYIITEWCEGGDLSVLIKNARDNDKYLEESFIWRILYQVSRAIQVCHSRLQNITIFHRDIKPANVFLDGHGNAKLGDFGLARIVMQEKEFSETIVGTPYYMSPELIKGSKYNRKSDIWALGCLIYELCSLNPPFTGANILELADTIKTGKYKCIPDQYSENLKKVISFMLSKKHEFRPTIEMILHHPSVVVNIKAHKEQVPVKAKQINIAQNSTDYDLQDVDKTLTSDFVNLTLVEPQHISNKVFKDKWVEKHEALKEREALLKKREKSLGDKERSLASREKHLIMLERQARQKQYLADLQVFKKNELAAREFRENGDETDISVEPGDTPIRPTSAKLDPARLPRPNLLTYACKKLEFERKIASNSRLLEANNKLSLDRSKTRRSFYSNFEEKKHVNFQDNNTNKNERKGLFVEQTLSTNDAHRQNESALKEKQRVNSIGHEFMKKWSTLKKETKNKGKCDKENVEQVRKIDKSTSKSSLNKEKTKKDHIVHFVV